MRSLKAAVLVTSSVRWLPTVEPHSAYASKEDLHNELKSLLGLPEITLIAPDPDALDDDEFDALLRDLEDLPVFSSDDGDDDPQKPAAWDGDWDWRDLDESYSRSAARGLLENIDLVGDAFDATGVQPDWWIAYLASVQKATGPTAVVDSYLIGSVESVWPRLRQWLDPGHPALAQSARSDLDPREAVVSVAHHYVLDALPYLHLYPVDLLLTWREILTDSIAAYRSAIREHLILGADLEPDSVIEDVLAEVAPDLDRLYQELLRDVRNHRLWKVTRDLVTNLPVALGPLVPALIIAPDLGVVNAVAGAGVGFGLQVTWEKVRRSRGFKEMAPHHPLYWRYIFESEKPLDGKYPNSAPGL